MCDVMHSCRYYTVVGTTQLYYYTVVLLHGCITRRLFYYIVALICGCITTRLYYYVVVLIAVRVTMRLYYYTVVLLGGCNIDAQPILTQKSNRINFSFPPPHPCIFSERVVLMPLRVCTVHRVQ